MRIIKIELNRSHFYIRRMPPMTTESATYQLWVNWQTHVASTSPVAGFDTVTFCSEENYQANLRILIQSGFRIQ